MQTQRNVYVTNFRRTRVALGSGEVAQLSIRQAKQLGPDGRVLREQYVIARAEPQYKAWPVLGEIVSDYSKGVQTWAPASGVLDRYTYQAAPRRATSQVQAFVELCSNL